jgi:hypothetical protein
LLSIWSFTNNSLLPQDSHQPWIAEGDKHQVLATANSRLSRAATQDLAKINMAKHPPKVKIPPKAKEISTDRISMELATTTNSSRRMAMANKETSKPTVIFQATRKTVRTWTVWTAKNMEMKTKRTTPKMAMTTWWLRRRLQVLRQRRPQARWARRISSHQSHSMRIRGSGKILTTIKRWWTSITLRVSILWVTSFHKVEYRHVLTSILAAGLSPAHIESFVHIGTFALAHLAKQAGMTAGHEPDEDEEEQAQAQWLMQRLLLPLGIGILALSIILVFLVAFSALLVLLLLVMGLFSLASRKSLVIVVKSQTIFLQTAQMRR